MALFSRKSPEEKAAKQEEKAVLEGKRKALADRVSRIERLNNGSAINVAADEIRDDEVIHFAATGELDNQDAKAALAATDQRIIIGWMKGFNLGHAEIRYEDIDQIDTGSKLNGTWATLRHGSHSTTLEKSATKNLDHLRNIVRERQGIPTQAPESSSATDQLSKLAELHAAGVLTDDEFAAAKAKALGM